jgi:hypothetical protein
MTTDAPIQTPEPGVHAGVPEHVYRAWDAVNQSTLWTFRRSAAHARYAFLHPSSTEATDIGGAIHAVTLEPDSLDTRYAVRPPGIDRRTREGKAAWAEFEAEAAGRIILEKRDVYDTLAGIRDSLRDHPLAYSLLTSPGLTELSALWRDPRSDVRCKGRMDRVVEHAGWTWIVDVKSTDDAGPFGFARSTVNFGYYLQAAFYLDGLAALSDRDRRFAFVAVEKRPPYAIAVYEPDIVFLEAGRDEYRRHMATWKKCQETGLWPGYPDGIETLESPSWFEKRLATREAA